MAIKPENVIEHAYVRYDKCNHHFKNRYRKDKPSYRVCILCGVKVKKNNYY